jgi:endonuclease YncB( thermonuclease family)
MRARLVLGLVLVCTASAATGQRRPPAVACASAEDADSIASVGERQEIRLASGRLARLSGLHFTNDSSVASPAAVWLMRHAGRALAVATTGPEDRWGRLPVRLKRRDEPNLDLAHGLVEEGLVVVDAPGPCQPELLAIEETARERGVGVWGDAGYKPAPADDREILAGRVGRFTLVEGRVRSVGERRQRTYLNFGPDGTKDLTITIPKRTWTTMVDKGLSAPALRGARIRVRGVLEVGRGPTIEVAAAEAIEVLDRGRDRR